MEFCTNTPSKRLFSNYEFEQNKKNRETFNPNLGGNLLTGRGTRHCKLFGRSFWTEATFLLLKADRLQGHTRCYFKT